MWNTTSIAYERVLRNMKQYMAFANVKNIQKEIFIARIQNKLKEKKTMYRRQIERKDKDKIENRDMLCHLEHPSNKCQSIDQSITVNYH